MSSMNFDEDIPFSAVRTAKARHLVVPWTRSGRWILVPLACVAKGRRTLGLKEAPGILNELERRRREFEQ